MTLLEVTNCFVFGDFLHEEVYIWYYKTVQKSMAVKVGRSWEQGGKYYHCLPMWTCYENAFQIFMFTFLDMCCFQSR